MPPESRPVPRFAADLPQEPPPDGRWAQRLEDELRPALAALGDDVGEVGEVAWFPDRAWGGRTYVPATARTSTGLEVFGYVSFTVAVEPFAFEAHVDVTEEVAEAHPEWRIDLCDEVVGAWRGEAGAAAQMTLVWGVSLVEGATVATAELGGRVTTTVDQCPVVEDRFTLLAPDDYRGDTLSVRVWSARGVELAHESLYDDED